MSKTKRQSGIELLRIIAMIQIIFLHAYQYGLLHDASKAAGDIDGILVTFVWSLCRTPVDVFIMISGYFMITSQFDIKKTIRRGGKIYGAMIFYSIYTFDNFLHKRSVAHKYKFSYKGVHSANVTNLVFSEQLFDYSSAQPISQQNACVTF